MAGSGVRRDGEYHNDNATDAIGDFLGDRDRILGLRLHPHAQTNEEAVRETLRPAAPDERQPGCFALEEERGGSWKGSSAPVIKEARPSLWPFAYAQ